MNKICCCVLLVFILLGTDAVAWADIPVGPDITISGQGAFIYTQDAAAQHAGNADHPLLPWQAYLFASWKPAPPITFYASGHLGALGEHELLGAFLRWKPEKTNLTLDVGRIPVPFGNAVYRNLPMRNALLDYPLIYGYPVSLRGDQLAASSSDLIQNGSGQGYFSHSFHGGGSTQAGPGLALVAPYPYTVGASLTWKDPHFLAAVAFTDSPPSVSRGAIKDIGKTVVGRLAWTPVEAWQVGVSYAHGPYLDPGVASFLPPGRGVNAYSQTLIGADVTYGSGPLQATVELARSKWETPNVGTLGATGWYAEARYKIRPGLYLAARHGELIFDRISHNLAALPSTVSWDGNVSRTEFGVGYYPSPNVLLKAAYEMQETRRGAPYPVTRTFGVGLNWRL